MRNEKWIGAVISVVKNITKGKGMLAAAFLISHFSSLIFTSCARMGSPDGGWYDDTPPYVVSSSPADGGVNVTGKKVTINFNEFIKIENAQEKVIVSPPQLEQAEIKAQGKRIIVELKDSLKENTTYTVDFSDAITDNNEGNPMGNYTFSFSTGDHIDTLEVSGYVLNAEDLEPVKGMLVGLYPYDAPDSAFHKEAMMRVSRTNGAGKFTIKGVAKGSYRVFGLNDADGDFSGDITFATVNKIGTGTQRFGGTVTVTTLNVNAGSVVLDGALSGAANVAAGAALGGSGGITNDVTFADGAKLAVTVANDVASCLTVAGTVSGGPVTVDAKIKSGTWRTAQCILTSGTSMGEMTFVKGEGIGLLELRNNGTELWATPKTSGLSVFIR